MKKISINNRRYIGSKYRMINFIDEVMKKEKIEYSSFLDLFGGTGIVGDFFNSQKTKVYVNDLVYTSGYGTIKEKLLIGKVIKVDNSDISKKVMINTVVDFNNLNYVLIVGDIK